MPSFNVHNYQDIHVPRNSYVELIFTDNLSYLKIKVVIVQRHERELPEAEQSTRLEYTLEDHSDMFELCGSVYVFKKVMDMCDGDYFFSIYGLDEDYIGELITKGSITIHPV